MLFEAVALVCLSWYIFIALVCAIGYIQLFRHYRSPPGQAIVLSNPDKEVPHVTIIRPCKGYEPYLYECLAATFQQTYPASRLSIRLCVASRADAAYQTIKRVVADYPCHDACVFVEDDDPLLRANTHYLGPNPKIRNMSRAYSEADGDIIWVLDCNVWVNPGACGRMLDKLHGYTKHGTTERPYKLVHHLPISVDVHSTLSPKIQRRTSASHDSADSTSSTLLSSSALIWPRSDDAFGGMLEELFLSSSHAKMYVAINTVALAPCIVGKSTMFRRSQLDLLTGPKSHHNGTPGTTGIDFFSHNICEDHLIGDLLWKSKLPPTANGFKYRNHGLVMGDYAIQPMSGMSIADYVARRVRWLRVRKYTVPAATAVEPGTESFVCSFMGAWGATTSPYTRTVFGRSWCAMLLWFVLSTILWALVDRTVYLLLHSGSTIEDAKKAQIPSFAKPLKDKVGGRRSFSEWGKAWLGREALALPIWLWAIWGGATVTWREKKFWVGIDMKVHEVDEATTTATTASLEVDATRGMNGHADGMKERVD